MCSSRKFIKLFIIVMVLTMPYIHSDKIDRSEKYNIGSMRGPLNPFGRGAERKLPDFETVYSVTQIPCTVLHKIGEFFSLGSAPHMGCQASTPASKKMDQSLMDESAPLDHAVIIVGAGVAGLACASRLKELGIEDVLILESRDRPGGRIHTVSASHGPLDLGAAWIHGVKGKLINNKLPVYL